MVDAKQTRILWVEADDEAQTLEDPHRPLRSLLCYLLVSDHVIIHPAYLLQSSLSRELVLPSLGRSIDNTNSDIFLGSDSESATSYIDSRLEKTRAHSIERLPVLTERAQYEAVDPRTIQLIADSLDSNVGAVGGAGGSVFSRDLEFRKLIRRDLVHRGILGDELSAILLRDAVPDRFTVELFARLNDWTSNNDSLVSVDTFLSQVVLWQNYTDVTLRELHRRLHVLHWACHVDANTSVPHVQRVIDPSKLDPFDECVFWSSLEIILGERVVAAWLGKGAVDAISIAVELKTTPVWGSYLKLYQTIIEVVSDDEGLIQEGSVYTAIDAALPSRMSVVFRRMRKLPLIKLVFNSTRTLAGDVSGAVPAAAGGVALLDSIVNSLQEYNESLREDVVITVRNILRRRDGNADVIPSNLL